MKRIFVTSITILILLSACMAEINTKAFQLDHIYAGPVMGFINYGNSLALGASAEYAFDEQIGLTADLAISKFEDNWSRYTIEYTFVGLLIGGAYHLRPDEVLDPYIKFGLGYFDFSYEDPYTGAPYDGSYTNGLGYAAQLGVRYVIKDNIMLKVGLGFPFFFMAGVDFDIPLD